MYRSNIHQVLARDSSLLIGSHRNVGNRNANLDFQKQLLDSRYRSDDKTSDAQYIEHDNESDSLPSQAQVGLRPERTVDHDRRHTNNPNLINKYQSDHENIQNISSEHPPRSHHQNPAVISRGRDNDRRELHRHRRHQYRKRSSSASKGILHL